MSHPTKGAIAAGHEKTAAAGKAMLDLGGNAFDAVIASVMAAFVVESALTSLGGGGFLLAHTAQQQNFLYDFFCQTPKGKKPLSAINFYPIDVDFGGQLQEFHIGLGSIAVPGNVAGVFLAHEQLGRLPLKEVVAPAIDYARNGFVVSHYQAYCLKLLAPILLALPESRKIYAPQGKILAAGDICYMRDFADTLAYLAEKGAKEFYQGEIAQQIVRDCQTQGGYLTYEDLASYRVEIRQPLATNYRGYQLLTNPPPSSGGILIAFALELLSSVDLSAIGFASKEHLELLAQVMSLTNTARAKDYDAFIYQPNIAEKLLNSDYLANYRDTLHQNIRKWGSTTHISVMDAEGNAASITTSNGEGSSYIVPGTGIMLNNMLGEADLNPLGFHNWQCDRRLSSMMSPTIILKNNQPFIVLGSGGSNRIRTAILQVISNIIDFHQSLQEAIANPRVHWEDGIFSIEPLPKPAVAKQLLLTDSTKLVLWNEKNMFFGGVNAVQRITKEQIVGAGDPRRGGVAIWS
ncbi:MAG: gamma-glutamyltransferase [Cyanobacteria bacterium J083]|nr:MAG: gamma-glutamyltransferase [Cyanobacteria bacterium J083]